MVNEPDPYWVVFLDRQQGSGPAVACVPPPAFSSPAEDDRPADPVWFPRLCPEPAVLLRTKVSQKSEYAHSGSMVNMNFLLSPDLADREFLLFLLDGRVAVCVFGHVNHPQTRRAAFPTFSGVSVHLLCLFFFPFRDRCAQPRNICLFSPVYALLPLESLAQSR